jgi:hypothetical protein
MEIKIDGQVIKLTSAQAQQFRKAILAETDVPAPKMIGTMTLCCKPNPTSYPLILASNNPASGFGVARLTTNHKGRDFNLTELQTFIKELKLYAAKIWPTAEKTLKNV